MAFVSRSAGQTIQSADVDQFVQFNTGLMPDQAATIGNSLTVSGNISAAALTSATPTLQVNGVAGSTTYTYKVLSKNSAGSATLVSSAPSATVTNGNATLGGGNTISVTWSPQTGAASYIVYDVVQGKQIATVTAVQGQTSNYTFVDSGQARSIYTPAATNGPGGLVAAQGDGLSQARLGGYTSGVANPAGNQWAAGDMVIAPGYLFVCTGFGSAPVWAIISNGTVYAVAGRTSTPENTSVPFGGADQLIALTSISNQGGPTWTLSGGGLVVPGGAYNAAATYQIHAVVTMYVTGLATNATGEIRLLVAINGTDIKGVITQCPNGYSTLQLSHVATCAPGDVVTMNIQNNSGVNQSSVGNPIYTRLTMRL